MSLWDKQILAITNATKTLEFFKTTLVETEKIIDVINNFPCDLENVESISLMGHFDNAFARVVETNLPKYPNFQLRIISLPFPKDSRGEQNRRALEKIEKAGGQVRVNDDLHVRIYLAYHSVAISQLMVGSFDFNRDGLSKAKTNIALLTHNQDLAEEALAFFDRIWESNSSKALKDF